MNTQKSGDETQLMPSPAQLMQDDASINDTRKIPTPEELLAAEKAIRVNAEYNFAMAHSAAGRHQEDAQRLREDLEALKYHDACREAGYAFYMQEVGKIEAQRDDLAYQLRKAHAQLDAREFKRIFSEELLKEFYATIEENVELGSRNTELSSEKSMLETRLAEETGRREEERLVIGCLAFAERKADNRAEALEQELKTYKERFGDVNTPAPLPRPGYLAKFYGLVAKALKAVIKI